MNFVMFVYFYDLKNRLFPQNRKEQNKNQNQNQNKLKS